MTFLMGASYIRKEDGCFYEGKLTNDDYWSHWIIILKKTR